LPPPKSLPLCQKASAAPTITRAATRVPSKMGLTFPLVEPAEDVWLDELDEDELLEEEDELEVELLELELLELTVTETMFEVTFSGVCDESVTVWSKYHVPSVVSAPVEMEGLEGDGEVEGVPRFSQTGVGLGASSSH